MTTYSEAMQELREEYPKGTRVALVYMDDPQAPPKGTEGTVDHVDSAGGIHIRWDNGSGLAAIYGEDIIKKIGREEDSRAER